MRIAHSYDAESRTVAFQQARAARDLALALVERTCRPNELADLYLILGQVNALMASLAFDLDRWQASEHLSGAATTYADMSGHASMKAWTLGLEATIAFWNGDGKQALDYVGAGLAVAPTGAPQFRLQHIAARAHAVAGNPDGVAAALAAADVQREIAAGKPDELHDQIGGEFHFGDSRAEACAGAAWLKVRDGERALASTQRALDLSADVSPGIKAGAQIDSAAACLMQGDLSEASARLEPVLHIDPDPQSVSLGARLGTVRHLLDEPPWAAHGPGHGTSRRHRRVASRCAREAATDAVAPPHARAQVLSPPIDPARRPHHPSASRPRCLAPCPRLARAVRPAATARDESTAHTPGIVRHSGISDH